MHEKRQAGHTNGAWNDASLDGNSSPVRLRVSSGFAILMALSVTSLAMQAYLRPVSHTHSRWERVLFEQAGSAAGTTAHALTKQQTPAKDLQYPVWWAAPFWSPSGYGSEAISFVTALLQTKLMRADDLWIEHKGDERSPEVMKSMEPHLRRLLQGLEVDHQRQMQSPAVMSRPPIVVCHTFPNEWVHPLEPGRGCCPEGDMNNRAYLIGRTMFETDRLHEHLVFHLDVMDEIWVPSQFNVDSFAASGVPLEKLFIVPQSVNLTVFDPSQHNALDVQHWKGITLVTGVERAANSPRDFMFLSVFKWEIRKGWDILLRTFIQEFRANEAVSLLIVTHAFHEDIKDWPELIRSSIRSERVNISNATTFESMPRIYLYSEYVPDAEYPRLYKSCDALVIPTRGEGWGRPQIEAMAMEKPVISTNWSGSTAFMRDDNSYPLRYDGLVDTLDDIQGKPPPSDNSPNFLLNLVRRSQARNNFFSGSSWAAPSPDHLRELMRHVATHPAEARIKGRAARRYLQQEFSPEAVAGKLFEQIMRVQGVIAARQPPQAPPPTSIAEVETHSRVEEAEQVEEEKEEEVLEEVAGAEFF